jgi:hypothetical protein
MRRNLLLLLSLVAVFSTITCAPHDEGSARKPASVDTKKADTTSTADVSSAEVPSALQSRIKAALQNITNRGALQPEQGFWHVFHGILGIGFEVPLLDPMTNKQVRAIDYICEGKPVKGLTFEETPYGIDVKTVPGDGNAQGHQDQFIAEMAQWGMPPSHKFKIHGRDYTFADFHRHSKMRASVKENQELSWAILIIGEYYGTDISWTNAKNEMLAFEDIVRYELGQPIDTAACGGTHRLFGLTWVYHRHLQKGGKTAGVWQEVAAKIDDYKKKAFEYKNRDGSFSTNYVSSPGQAKETGMRIGSTGHVLEWLALAMNDQELKSRWMQDAADALVKMILDNRADPIEGGALYHAAHGLHIYYNRLFGSLGNDPLIPLPPKNTRS